MMNGRNGLVERRGQLVVGGGKNGRCRLVVDAVRGGGAALGPVGRYCLVLWASCVVGKVAGRGGGGVFGGLFVTFTLLVD